MKSWLKNLSFWVVVVGAVIYGLMVFGYSMVDSFFGTSWNKLIYAIVGISGIIQIVNKFSK